MKPPMGKSCENRLGDGLEIAPSNGAESLAAIAGGPDAINVAGPRGERWDERRLETGLERLAAAPGVAGRTRM